MKPQSHDIFYFYNSSIGSLENLIQQYSISGLKKTKGYITNSFGVKIDPKHLPDVLTGKEGLEAPPIPSNWHADIAEFGSAIRAITLAKNTFTMAELGCGWGCWMNITGVIAKRMGLDVYLIGVEGDKGHVAFAEEALTNNGFAPEEYVIHNAIAGSKTGVAFFPVQDKSGIDWGLEPVFPKNFFESKKLDSDNKYQKLSVISLNNLLPKSRDQLDLLHVDIQGGEVPLLAQSMDFLNKSVSMVLIGTHSREIEGELFNTFFKNGWVLEVERPAIIQVGTKEITQVDGVQLWRNTQLTADNSSDQAKQFGSLRVVKKTKTMSPGKPIFLEVEVINDSETDWLGTQCEFPVRFSYKWLDLSGKEIVSDGIRTNFPFSVLSAKSKVIINAEIHPPNVKGDFVLFLNLVQEGMTWFSSPDFESESLQIRVG